MSVLRGLLDDLTSAARSLRRRPGPAAAAAFCLALGVGAATTVWSAVQAVLLDPLPLPGSERLALVWSRSDEDAESWLSVPEIDDLRAGSGAFSGVAALRDWSFHLTGGPGGAGAEPEEVPALAVSSDLFPLLDVEPVLGRVFRVEEDRPGARRVAVLGHDLWRRRFGGDPAILGRAVLLDREPHVVVGVLPAGFRLLPPSSVFPERVDVWVPLGATLPADGPLLQRDVRHLHALARLAPGATLERANADLARLAAGLKRDHPAAYQAPGWGLAVVPFHEQIVRGVRPALLALAVAVGLLLLAASVNLAGLLLARTAGRSRELAVRAALGASRGRLARHLLAETLLLGFAGAAGGLLIAAFGVDLLAAAPAGVPRLDEIRLDGRVLAAGLALGLFAALLAGPLPAAAAARAALPAGQGDVSAGSHRGRARRLLAAGEIALALVLLAGTGLLLRSFLTLHQVPLGFEPEGVLTARLPLSAADLPDGDARNALLDRLLPRLASLPGVQAVGAVTQLPLSGAVLGSRFANERGDESDADFRHATPGYLPALGIRLLRGRGFTGADREDAPLVAVVDETLAARLWPRQDPIGRQLTWLRAEDRPLTVVGVAAAVHHTGPGAAAEPTVYRPYAQDPRAGSLYLIFRTIGGHRGRGIQGNPAALAGPLRDTLRQIAPQQPLADVRPMSERAAAALAPPRFHALLTGLFAATALALAAVGVYGVIAHGVTRRRREIGVRLALGAPRRRVLAGVLAEGLALAALGLAVGLPAALAAGRLLQSQLFGVSASDPWTLTAAALALALTAAAAAWLPARRAAAVDPASALAAE
jgi:putative ABC transport system permease protein